MENSEITTTKINRTHRVYIRVTEEEDRLISALASTAGLGVSEYIRRTATGQQITQLLTAEERNALIGLGRNLNQAMVLSHAHGQVVPGVSNLIEALKKILTA